MSVNYTEGYSKDSPILPYPHQVDLPDGTGDRLTAVKQWINLISQSGASSGLRDAWRRVLYDAQDAASLVTAAVDVAAFEAAMEKRFGLHLELIEALAAGSYSALFDFCEKHGIEPMQKMMDTVQQAAMYVFEQYQTKSDS